MTYQQVNGRNVIYGDHVYADEGDYVVTVQVGILTPVGGLNGGSGTPLGGGPTVHYVSGNILAHIIDGPIVGYFYCNPFFFTRPTLCLLVVGACLLF